jgi:hypothetical protein
MNKSWSSHHTEKKTSKMSRRTLGLVELPQRHQDQSLGLIKLRSRLIRFSSRSLKAKSQLKGALRFVHKNLRNFREALRSKIKAELLR